MKLRLRKQETGRGEWSILDQARGYRICHFNHPHHGGTHIHYPETSSDLETVDIGTPQEAEQVMRLYHELHDAFNLVKLTEVIQAWKSVSDAA